MGSSTQACRSTVRGTPSPRQPGSCGRRSALDKHSHPHPPGIPRFWPIQRVQYGWAIVAASFLASFAEVPGFGPVLGVFIKPIEDELGWSRATIATGFLIGSASGAFVSGITGRLVDRFGARVVVAVAGLAIAGALWGLSTIQEPWQFWTYFGIARGSAIAGVEIGTSVAVAKWFVRRRGRALAFRAVGQRSGQAVLPIFIFFVMAASDWRMAYVALSGFSAIVIIVPSLILLRNRPEDHGLRPDGIREAPQPSGLPPPSERASPAPVTVIDEESWTLREAQRTRAFWLITVFLMCTPFVQGATNLHMVANFQDQGLSDGQAFSIASIFATASALSIVPIGFILERVHVRTGAIVQAVFVLTSMLMLLVADNYPLAVAWALVFGVGAGMRNVVEVLLVANYFGRESLGAIKGFTAPFRAVSPLGPVIAAFTFDRTGSYTLAFTLFAGVAVLMLVLMLFASQPRKPAAAALKGFTAPFRAVSPLGPVIAAFTFDRTGSYTLAFTLFAGVAVLMLVLMLFASQPRKPAAAALTPEPLPPPPRS